MREQAHGQTRAAFLAGVAAAPPAFIIGGTSPPATAGTGAARIEILPNEPLGTIAPEIYGHFAENLGGVVYDGIWVGPDSTVPNIGGIRKVLVDAMRAIKPAVIRYPGGCFADSYDWRDGVGPASSRPRRTNFWADSEAATAPAAHKYDGNQFGTDEFVQFCRLVGAAPYLAANVRSLPGETFDQWVEYCNAPAGATTLSDVRAADGSPQPYGVRWWAVGNEAWGCGGAFTPQEYAEEFCRYTASVPDYGVGLRFVASGPNGGDSQWTRGFFEALARRGNGAFDGVYGFALHDYTWNLSRGTSTDWVRAKGDALRFDAVDWYELMRQGSRMETLINEHWRIMGETDTKRRVRLVVDEWGAWYRPGSEATAGDLFEQTPTMRDAVFSAMTLDIFNRHCDKVAMANCAQLINCLNSLYLAHGDKFCATPVAHVFGMYAAHQGAQSVRAVFDAPEISYDRDGKAASFWGLNGSASLHDKAVTLTVVNPHVSAQRETLVTIRGGAIAGARITTIGGGDIHAHNSFEQADTVRPATSDVRPIGGRLTLMIPAASVSKVTLTVA